MATNTYVIEGSFTSAGGVYDLQLPIETVQTNSNSNIASTTTQPSLVAFELFNYSKYGTNSNSLEMKWFKGMPNASALILTRGTTTLSSTLETTNGFTIINNTPIYGVEIVSVTNANPGVFTFRGPGFNPGQGIPAFATGDTVKFSFLAGSASWQGINGTAYSLTKISSTTFSVPVDTTAFGAYTASSGIAYRTQTLSGTLIPPFNSANVGIRLGSACVGSNGDVFYFKATISDDSRALGQL